MKFGYKLLQHKNPSISVTVANLKLLFRRSHLRINYDPKKNLFFIKDNENTHFFGNLVRGHRLYQKGLTKRANELFNSYLLAHISFKNDIVIDCGANYGDLWLALVQKNKPRMLHHFRTWNFGAQRHKIKRSRWCT